MEQERTPQWRPQTLPCTGREPLPTMITAESRGHTSMWVDISRPDALHRQETTETTTGLGVAVANTTTFYGPVTVGRQAGPAGQDQPTDYAAVTQAVHEALSYYLHAVRDGQIQPDEQGGYHLTITGDDTTLKQGEGGQVQTAA